MPKTKKLKSFTLDEAPYDALFGMFKGNYVDVSLSYCLNKYIKELLRYLEAIQGEMNRTGDYTMPMAFVIETVARSPIFQVPEDRVVEGSEGSALMSEVKELQRRYDAYRTKGAVSEADETENSELDTMTGIVKFAKVIAKIAAREMSGRKLTDDEYIEMVRKEGGKPLHKMLREKFAPAMGFDTTGKGSSRAKAKKDTEE